MKFGSRRELDKLISETIFKQQVNEVRWGKHKQYTGYTLSDIDEDAYADYVSNELPYYSNDVIKAYEVINRLQDEGFECQINMYIDGPQIVKFYRGYTGSEYIASAFSVPEAICRAALKIYGIHV